MSLILQRLQTSVTTIPDHRIGDQWIFKEALRAQNTKEFIPPLLLQRELINLELEVLCTQIAKELTSDEQLLDLGKLEEALVIAELLDYLYSDYLDVAHEIPRLRHIQTFCRAFLKTHYRFEGMGGEETGENFPFGKTVREWSAYVNWARLFINRTRRLLLLTDAALQTSQELHLYTRFVDRYIGPPVIHFGWLFFAPRFVVSLGATFKHVIPGPWLSEEEKQFSWWTRLKVQLTSRWFFLSNDVFWLTAGLLNCFLFTGKWLPFGVYFTIACQAYDVVLVLARLYIENHRLQSLLKEDYPDAGYQKLLEERIDWQLSQVKVLLLSNCLVLLGVSMALPFIAFHPLIPLSGAAISVLSTIWCYEKIKQLSQEKPSLNLPEIGPDDAPTETEGLKIHGLFSQSLKPQKVQNLLSAPTPLVNN